MIFAGAGAMPAGGRLAQSRRLKLELERAARLDPGLRRLLDALGYPQPRTRQPGFATLLRIIVSQQLSTGVSAAIWRRLERLCRGQITHRKILNRSDEQLGQCGLSRQKIAYIRGLAKMVQQKTLDLEALGARAAADQPGTEALIAELCRVRGIGRWSAEIYAMFALGHPDVFPAADLALQVAVQRYAGLERRPDAKTTAALAEKWSPHRSSVALLMWKYYGSATLD